MWQIDRFTNFKIVITTWQKVIKLDRYYKVRQKLSQTVTRVYYKVWQVLQSVVIIAKWDVTTENGLEILRGFPTSSKKRNITIALFGNIA